MDIKTIQVNYDKSKEYEPCELRYNEDIISSDFAWDFMFGGECVCKDYDFVGFVRIAEDDDFADTVMWVRKVNNSFIYRFPDLDYLSQDNIDFFLKQLADSLKDAVAKGLAYDVVLKFEHPFNNSYTSYDKQIIVSFYLEKE